MTRLELNGIDAVGLRAANPGPFTLSGTNSWIVGRHPARLIDPGPALDEHLDALDAEIARRGGLGAILLTHGHPDHAEAVPKMARRHPDASLEDLGPLEALALRGHSPDHRVLLLDDVVFSGDAILGEGSVFIAPDPGALGAYLAGLEALARRRPRLIAPGHGPVVEDPAERIAGYIAHRLAREERLVAALAQGRRGVEELLDAAWAEVPEILRPAAAVTLAAHLDKLEEEGRLPAGVERPAWPVAFAPQ